MPALTRLAVLGDVGTHPFHVGDEAMLQANLATLRRLRPALEVEVLGREAASAESLSKALDAVQGLWISGGGNLSSTWPDLLRQRVLAIDLATERALPVVVTGQTLGPNLSPDEARELGRALARSAFVGLRELPSMSLALRLGVPRERLWYQPDDAAFLAPRQPGLAEPPRPYLALTFDPSFTAADHVAGLDRIAHQAARFARRQGLEARFVPHVGELGGLGDEDAAAGRAIERLFTAEGVPFTLLEVCSAEETVWWTQRAAVVISSRYHPLVFAVGAAVPCLALHRDAYTRIKLEGALAHAEMDQHALSAEAAEAGQLEPALDRLWAERAVAGERMRAARQRSLRIERARWRELLHQLEPARDRDLLHRLRRTLARRFGAKSDTVLRGTGNANLAAQALASLGREQAARPGDLRRERAGVRHVERLLDFSRRRESGVRIGSAAVETMGSRGSRMLTDEMWDRFAREGFLHLGTLLDAAQVEALKARADDLALGRLSNPKVVMQLDTGGAYEALPAAVDRFEQPSLSYRKIQGLEADDLFSQLVTHAVCLEVCRHQYGAHAPVSIFRAMVMNKPAGQGTELPWHQDGGEVWKLDRDPLVTIWVALDPATRANGCMEVVPGSHRLGLLTNFGSTISDDDAARHCPDEKIHPLEVEAGHAVLIHNWLIHRSGVNPSPIPRRAFTACYMDGRTLSTLTGNPFPLIAGSLPAEPYAFVNQLLHDCAFLRESHNTASDYAHSLEREVARLASAQAELENRLRELEASRDRMGGAPDA